MGLVKVGQTEHYYRSVRIGGKVRRLYVGSGATAQAAAAADACRREEKQLERQVLQADRERWEVACTHLDRLVALTDLLVDATFLANGYHRHHHGAWRRRRDSN